MSIDTAVRQVLSEKQYADQLQYRWSVVSFSYTASKACCIAATWQLVIAVLFLIISTDVMQ